MPVASQTANFVHQDVSIRCRPDANRFQLFLSVHDVVYCESLRDYLNLLEQKPWKMLKQSLFCALWNL